jgi:type VI secretion system protein ImpC
MPISDIGLEAEFTFEGDPGRAVDEPPFRILMLGDWSGGAAGPFPGRRPIEIDRDNFDEVMARLKPRADLDFEDGSTLSLEFGSLDDLHPDEIFRRVPVFSELRDLRKRLRGTDSFNAAAREARQMFGIEAETNPVEAAGSSVENAGDSLLDSILAQPSGGAAAPKRGASGELGGLVKELVRSHLVSVDEDEQSTLISAVDAATSRLMRSILHHRRFQELEAAWRGLFFQVRRTDTAGDLKIYILDISKEELENDLRSADELSTTLLYKVLIRDAVETPGSEPWAFVGGNFAFSPTVDDIAALMRVSRICAAAGAPFVAHMRPDVLGIHSLAEHPDPVEWNTNAETDAAKLWTALRGQAESQYLGMTMPRFLARLPYGFDTEPLETFGFEEFDGEPFHDGYCWANASFLSALLHARSYSAYGWDEMGGMLEQDIEGLPLHMYKAEGETVYKPCAEIQMTDKGVEKLMEFGLTPLISYRSMDKVRIGRHQSVADPVTGLRGRWNS